MRKIKEIQQMIDERLGRDLNYFEAYDSIHAQLKKELLKGTSYEHDMYLVCKLLIERKCKDERSTANTKKKG